jgi:hypothetical protein
MSVENDDAFFFILVPSIFFFDFLNFLASRTLSFARDATHTYLDFSAV